MRNSLRLAFVAITLIFSSNVARADTLTFGISQAGWTGGGEVIGMFSGEDLNSDGFLTLDGGEISSYMGEFTGNNLIPRFTHDLGDLRFFRYTLGSPGFPPSFPLFSDNGSFFYDADDGIIGGSPFNPPFISTSQPAVVVAVSEPLTVILLGTGLAGIAARGLKRTPSAV